MTGIEYASPLDEFEFCVEHTGCWMYLGLTNVDGWPVSVHYSMRSLDDRMDIDREAELRHEIGSYLPSIMRAGDWPGRVFMDYAGRRSWRVVPAAMGYGSIH